MSDVSFICLYPCSARSSACLAAGVLWALRALVQSFVLFAFRLCRLVPLNPTELCQGSCGVPGANGLISPESLPW